MKKWLSIVLVLLLTAALFAGCGASSAENGRGNDLAGSTSVDGSLDDEYVSESGSSAESTPQPAEGQKMVYKVWLEAETEDIVALLENVEQQISELNGYIESQEQHNGSQYSSKRYRSAELTIRIPTEQLDNFVTHVSEFSNVVSKRRTAENITLNYVATQSRITALETEQTRLLELLAKAESMSDILDIEQRLTKVRTELEEYQSQLRVFDNQIDYSTIYLSISEVKEYTEVKEPETVWERIGSGFMESLENIGNFLVDLFVFLIVAFPYLIPLLLPLAIIIPLVRKKIKKNKRKEEENKTE